MKRSIITDIFNGVRGQSDTTHSVGKGEADSTSKLYDELRQKLSPELLALHNDFVESLTQDFVDEVDGNFKDGFKLGILVGIECME